MPTCSKRSESGFQAAVLAAAKMYGWMVHAERPAVNRRGKWSTPIQGDAGFPDLVLVHPKRHRVLVIELKRAGERPTDGQNAWLSAFALAGVPAYWFSDNEWPELERLLRG